MCFFSIYRPSCIIEAYRSPKKYWLVSVGLLDAHIFNFHFIFSWQTLDLAQSEIYRGNNIFDFEKKKMLVNDENGWFR
jgi:hypothetical protein